MCAWSVAQSCLTLCDPMDFSLPGSSVHAILQAGILEWLAMPFLRGCSQTRDQTWASWIACRFFTIWVTREAPYVSVCLCVYVCIYIYAQSCPALYNPMYCSPPGSSVHGILQAQILEWVSIPFSRESGSLLGRQILYHWVTWEFLAFSFCIKWCILLLQLPS